MPKVVVAMSGKRKSGKDFCATKLAEFLKGKGKSVVVCGVSHSLKKEYAEMKGLDFKELLTDGPYKEEYRKEMIVWGEEKRRTDPGYFCRAVSCVSSSVDVLIVPDCRRPTDFSFFEKSFSTVSLRIRAPESVRTSRGWAFTVGVDDAGSECALDGRTTFDVILDNDSDEKFERGFSELCMKVLSKLEN